MKLYPIRKESLSIYLYWIDYTRSDFKTTFNCSNIPANMGKMHSSVKRAQKGTGHGWPALISYDDLFTKTQNLIVDGVLTLEFEVMIINPPYANIHFHEFFVAGAS